MREKLRKIKISDKFTPLIIFAVTIAAYLPLVSQMGFYWDDWVMLYFKISRGSEGFAAAFTSDRPFLSYLYQLTAYLPNDPIVWQILTVLVRYFVSLSFWWVLKQLWEDHDKEILWMSMLLAVYPGFKQMPITYVWLNGLLLLLSYVLSFGTMLKALRCCGKTRIVFYILSVLLYSFCVVSTEYYVGLELCRGIVLWLFFCKEKVFQDKTTMKKAKNVITYWLPYIAIMGVFIFWRVFIFKFPGYQPVLVDQAAADPLEAIWDTLVRAVEDAFTASWGAWTEYIKFPNHVDFETKSGKIFWIVVLFLFVCVLTISRLYVKKDSHNKTKWAVASVFIGLFMLISPGFPFWVTYLPIRLSYPYDRFLVAFMFGSCIFMVGLIHLTVRYEWMKSTVLSLLIAAAVGGNILNANSYRKDWNMQKEFVSQLRTRIPSLKPNTILLSGTNPLSYESDNSMTGMVNLAFDAGDDYPEDKLPYSVLLFKPRFGNIENYQAEETVYQDFRGLLFEADNDNVVVYHYSPPSCLRIIDPELHADLSIYPSEYNEFIGLSRPKDRIITSGVSENVLLEQVFNSAPEQNWCYYFQKAELARQEENWAEIAMIGDKVLPIMTAADKTEYFVFAEAYMHMNRWNTAGELFGRIHHESEGSLDNTLCKYIHKWASEYPPDQENINGFINELNAVGCVYGNFSR